MRGLLQVRRYTDRLGDTRLDGYANHGPNWPVYPPWIIMEDRVTGTRYALTIVDEAVSLDTDLPSEHYAIYGPFDGPYVDEARLYISDGTLAAETTPGLRGGRVFARQGLSRTYIEVTVIDGEIVYSEYTDPSAT